MCNCSKKCKLVAVFLLVITFGLGMCVSCLLKNEKFAIVDVQNIIANSPEIKNLKTEQEKTIAEIAEWVKGPNSEIEKIKDKAQKEELAQKYIKELEQKKHDMQTKYVQELQRIDAKITNIIGEVAKEKGYKRVFAKSTLIVGGEDITEDVIKKVK
ncbi:MAG: OmpH family outer membrane protein [Alphaproteobacteria bacterium]|nr:OmpH family outer membrane protein [Alphaproteobacteria bacterium]